LLPACTRISYALRDNPRTLGTNAANVAATSGTAPAQPASGGNEGATAGVAPIKLSVSAAAGQQMFQLRGCVLCHGSVGQGARAPAMAPLIAKVADTQLTQLLQNPNPKIRDFARAERRQPPGQESAAESSSLQTASTATV
jgi:cytochrome c553